LHDHSTRAQPHRHHSRGKTAVAVVAVLSFVSAVTVLGPSLARSAQAIDIELSSAPEAAALGADVTSPDHDIAIEIVTAGREGLELSARLTDDGGLIELPIGWTIRNMDGDIVYSGQSPSADFTAPPGDYAVDISYGAVRLSSTVTLLETNRLMVSYVLNAGGLRILPRVKDVAHSTARAQSRIFALGGRQRGKLVALSEIPGEIVRIPEGDYRVESRFFAGNAAAVTDVHVRAGRMSALEIDHKAGIARLAFVGSPEADVRWNVSNHEGQSIAMLEGLNADIVLLPGTYTARAKVGSEILTATFAIAAGEARDILLGN
jgi:hypothetical protein